MPGTLTIQPIRANLKHNRDLFSRMDPYVEFLLGGQKVKTSVCLEGGRHPYWNNIFTLPSNNEPILYVNLKDKDFLSHDDNIGTCQIDLRNIYTYRPHGPQWYPVTNRHGSEGEILIDISYNPGMQIYQQPYVQPYSQPYSQPYGQSYPVYGGVHNGFPGQMPPPMPMTQPTVVYNAPTYPVPQPMTGYPMTPTTAYPQAQPMMTQPTYPAYPTVQSPITYPMTQPQVYPNQGYAPTQHAGQFVYKTF